MPLSPYYIRLYVHCAHTLSPSFDQLGRQKTVHISLWWWIVHICWQCCQVEQWSQSIIYVMQVGRDGKLWFVGVVARIYDYTISWISCGLILTLSWTFRNDLHCFCFLSCIFLSYSFLSQPYLKDDTHFGVWWNFEWLNLVVSDWHRTCQPHLRVMTCLLVYPCVFVHVTVT